jgi:hypothetical protein
MQSRDSIDRHAICFRALIRYPSEAAEAVNEGRWSWKRRSEARLRRGDELIHAVLEAEDETARRVPAR